MLNETNNILEFIIVIHTNENKPKCLLLLKDKRLAASFDEIIKIYNPSNNYQCELTFKAHDKPINYLCILKNGKIISCSNDKSIKIWSIYRSSYVCDYTIENAHKTWISKIITLSQERIASCSDDCTIKIWQSNYPYNLITFMKGHTNWINSIIQLSSKEILISGSEDSTIQIWNLKTYQNVSIITEVHCNTENSLIEIDNNSIIVSGFYFTAIININLGIIEQKIENENNDSIFSLLFIGSGNVLFGYSNGKIGIYNINRKIIQIVIQVHSKEIVQLIKINQNQYLSASSDRTIKVLEYHRNSKV